MIDFPDTPRYDLQRLVLAGFMGAGKSTIGKLIALRTAWEFIDLDTYIETRNGKTARELFEILGETGFRQQETDLWASVLQRSQAIIAPGGAVIDKPENQRILAQSPGTFVVFLDGPFEDLIGRCREQERSGSSTYRPLLHRIEMARAKYLERRMLYASHAHRIVDVRDRSPEAIAEDILQDVFPKTVADFQMRLDAPL